MNSRLLTKLILVLCNIPVASFAQEDWKFNSALTAMTGNYKDSLTMSSQHGTGVRLTGEYRQQWGVTVGLQSTRINMKPLTQTATQDQDNWLLSGYMHTPSTFQPGRWTLQLDGYQINNDAKQGNSDGVRVIAPQVSWLSHTMPLKLDAGYANSSYRNTPTIHQVNAGVGFGFNNQRNWAQIRGYAISNLASSDVLGKSQSRTAEFKLTQFLTRDISFVPTSITIGAEVGKKIYSVDMLTQTVYNLPMANEGSKNIAAAWKLSQSTDLTLFASKTTYHAIPIPAPQYDHKFTLTTLSAQLTTAW